MVNYRMLVVIPITNVPETTSIQEAKVESEIWLKGKIPDATVIEFTTEE